jgi:hypothetical protein
LGYRKTGYAGIAYQPDSVDGSDYLIIAVNRPNTGIRLHWTSRIGIDTGDYADCETSWLEATSLAWADSIDHDILLTEATHGAFLLRRVGKLSGGATSAGTANIVRWNQPSLNLWLHPETALELNETSRNSLLRACLYVWDNGGSYQPPTIVVSTVSADGVETVAGTMTEEQQWGNVVLMSLPVERTLPEGQYLLYTITRAAGATYIGILEGAFNMAITVDNIMDAIALGVGDPDMDDYPRTEIRTIAKDAIMQIVVAGRTHKEDVPLTLVEDQVEYSAEPCFEPTLVALGGQALDHLRDGDQAGASWDSDIPGIPDAWRQETGGKIRVNPKPSAAALGIIGEIEETPTAGGTGYEEGDILTITQSGASGGQVEVETVSSGVVTKVKLLMRQRSTRGSGYTAAAGLATTTTGDGTGCTVEIAALATLEVTGYSGIAAPTSDSDVILAIPEHYIEASVVPLGIAMALENRRTGSFNVELAERKREEAFQWVGRMDSSLRGRG